MVATESDNVRRAILLDTAHCDRCNGSNIAESINYRLSGSSNGGRSHRSSGSDLRPKAVPDGMIDRVNVVTQGFEHAISRLEHDLEGANAVSAVPPHAHVLGLMDASPPRDHHTNCEILRVKLSRQAGSGISVNEVK